jgi:uncharacterized membrane protein
LILAAELFVVDDRYGPAFERMNIVFKFHLSAIVLLAEAAGALVAAAWASLPRQARRVAVAVPLAAAALACAVYPAGSVLSAMRIPGPRTLDGMASLRRDHPGDAAAVEWLSAVSGSPTIVEATGEPYSYVSRISSSTGLPTILGWANHERLWRGDPASLSEIDARVKAVRTVYEGDAVRADQVLRQFGVRYVIFGDVERRLYPAARAETLNRLGRQVLERSGTSVYEVPDLSASGASGARP